MDLLFAAHMNQLITCLCWFQFHHSKYGTIPKLLILKLHKHQLAPILIPVYQKPDLRVTGSIEHGLQLTEALCQSIRLSIRILGSWQAVEGMHSCILLPNRRICEMPVNILTTDVFQSPDMFWTNLNSQVKKPCNLLTLDYSTIRASENLCLWRI